MLRTVRAVRYVLPFREGGSVPALVEADDLGLYVVKLRGAGQGTKALIAELIAGEIGRSLGLDVPEIALVELDRGMAASEPDPELCLPLEASAGLNLGLDFLPGSVAFDPVASRQPEALMASRIVLFDALVTNVDRTARNTNLLVWHGKLWLIDHGAALYAHHAWPTDDLLEGASDPFLEVRAHVLLPWATKLREAAEAMRIVDDELIDRIVAAIPAQWLGSEHGFADDASHRSVYRAWLRARIGSLPTFLEEAERARALPV